MIPISRLKYFAGRLLLISITTILARGVYGDNAAVVLPDKNNGDGVASGTQDTFVQLEGVVLAAIESERDVALALDRMWASARNDVSSGNAYLESMERLLPMLTKSEEIFDSRLRMARTADFVRNFEYADQLYDELAGFDPELETKLGRTAMFQHAQSYLHRGDNEKAANKLRGIWDTASHHSQEEFLAFGQQLADTYYRMEDWTSLIEVTPPLIGELSADPATLGTLEHLAKAYLMLGELDLAVEHYQRLYNFLNKLGAEDPGNQIFQIPGYTHTIAKQLEHARRLYDAKRLYGHTPESYDIVRDISEPPAIAHPKEAELKESLEAAANATLSNSNIANAIPPSPRSDGVRMRWYIAGLGAAILVVVALVARLVPNSMRRNSNR